MPNSWTFVVFEDGHVPNSWTSVAFGDGHVTNHEFISPRGQPNPEIDPLQRKKRCAELLDLCKFLLSYYGHKNEHDITQTIPL